MRALGCLVVVALALQAVSARELKWDWSSASSLGKLSTATGANTNAGLLSTCAPLSSPGWTQFVCLPVTLMDPIAGGRNPSTQCVRGRLEWVCTAVNKAQKYWSSICPRKRHKWGCAKATGLRACTAACRINAGQGNDGGMLAGGAQTGGLGNANSGDEQEAAQPPLPPGVARPPALPGTPRYARQQVCSYPWLASMMPLCHWWQADYLLSTSSLLLRSWLNA